MARSAKKVETTAGLSLKIVNSNAAGIDISATEMQVCVLADRGGENNPRFGCYTKDFCEISSYLQARGIDTVVMESTGVYWLPLFMLLWEDGFDVMIPNKIKGVVLTDEQKAKLAAGEKVFLKDIVSQNGKKFSNIVVYVD
ncbi:MAG: DUF3945 domain-containing protein [Massilibacteroides sp.]|nr:DUF3945 domain-containing protein [Massilibacteroides sp.]MDD3062807.1 DUF3945 domain-containing protein [Massilibacteroides sp.]MDD4115669.1 DUF3945 domain-containing protein [Massilibacteroides sp.]MDD4659387.1 DUF3945 domain-containing protein [Massilibacteroides sp.]